MRQGARHSPWTGGERGRRRAARSCVQGKRKKQRFFRNTESLQAEPAFNKRCSRRRDCSRSCWRAASLSSSSYRPTYTARTPRLSPSRMQTKCQPIGPKPRTSGLSCSLSLGSATLPPEVSLVAMPWRRLGLAGLPLPGRGSERRLACASPASAIGLRNSFASMEGSSGRR